MVSHSLQSVKKYLQILKIDVIINLYEVDYAKIFYGT